MNTASTEDLKTLAAPSRAAIIVIDPQHDFCSEKGALAERFGFDIKASTDLFATWASSTSGGSLLAQATVNEQFAVGR